MGDNQQTGASMTPPARADDTASSATACYACGAPARGEFCALCGQKHDDMRRSIFSLARDFIEDTFNFDSRMWRTLGTLAAKPGVAPKAFAHGQRSRYTPPVRLFLVVSFLFFLTLSFTQTLFVAITMRGGDEPAGGGITLLQNNANAEASADADDSECSMVASLDFFVRASELDRDHDKWRECIAELQAKLSESVRSETEDAPPEAAESAERAITLVNTMADGVGRAIENPEAFNAVFNNWLPRILLLMAPVTALILILFIRGRDALFYDHLVLALYSHAMGFAAIGAAVVLTQAGLTFMGLVAAIFIYVYIVRSLKKAYGRGWVKTVWTATAGGFLYMLILSGIVLAIVYRAIMQGA